MNTKVRGTCSIGGCGLPHSARGWCHNHYLRWRKHGNPTTVRRFPADTPVMQILAARIDRSAGEDACWPWIGARNSKGYGNMRFRGKTRLVTHVVYELDRGHPPELPCVLHTCDNPPCSNPRHLWSGTNLDNVQDKERKGRGNQPKGEHHHLAKLTVQQIRRIRRRYESAEVSLSQLGREFGVHYSTISSIVKREAWAHIP